MNDSNYIIENITKLPTCLIKKIYILCMRTFWRNYIPITAKIPSWYDHYITQQNLLFNAIQNNIHFMHLPCITLPEYKKYIPGCQCKYCKNEVDITIKFIENIKINEDYEHFYEIIPDTGTKWNNLYEYIILDEDIKYGFTIFKADYDHNDIKNKILSDIPIKFK